MDKYPIRSQDELAMSSSMALTSTSFPVTQLPRSEFVMGHVKEVSDPWQGKLKDGLVGEFPLVTVSIIV